MKNKIFLLLLPIALLSASCNPWQKPVAAGMVKTVNGGVDWQFINAVKDNKNSSLSGLTISKLVFDPKNRETVYAGSYNGGMYKSEDSGANWSRILSKIYVYDFVIHPTDSKIIFVAGYFGDHGKVLKTADGGVSWQEIYNEATASNIVRAIALNPASPNQMVIGLGSGSIIRSADGGLSWSLVGNFDDRVSRMAWQNNNLYVLLKTKGLMKSTDFGNNFQSLTDNLVKNITSVSSYITTETTAAFNQFYVDPLSGSLIYLTTGRGLYKSTDEGKNWAKLALPVKSGNEEAWAIAVAQSSSNLVFTNVGATVYKSTDGGNSWQTQNIATNGFINYILIDPQLPQIAYGGIYVSQ